VPLIIDQFRASERHINCQIQKLKRGKTLSEPKVNFFKIWSQALRLISTKTENWIGLWALLHAS